MESASQGGNPAMANVLRDTLIALTTTTIIITKTMADSAAVRSIIMNAMEHAPQSIDLATESVLMGGLIVEVSAAVKSTIMTAMELVPPSTEPAMESVLRDYLNVTDTATLNRIRTSIIMSVMESVPISTTPARESVLRDMLRAINIATLKILLTHTTGTVEARDNALANLNNATEPAPREEQSVETTCASAVMMTLTAGKTATTTEIAMAPASEIGRHVTRPASLDTITAISSMAVSINMAMKHALKRVPLTNTMNIAMTAISV